MTRLIVNLFIGRFPFPGSFPSLLNGMAAIGLCNREGRNAMLKILIVEDDRQLALTLKYLVEDNPRYRVAGIAADADSAIRAAEQCDPDLALVDLKLANGSTGFQVAVRLVDLDVPALFITGRAPDFPMPDLALGCLMKPFTAEEIHRSLAAAEDVLRGREAVRLKLPSNFALYEDETMMAGVEPGFTPSRRSFRTFMSHWLSSTRH